VSTVRLHPIARSISVLIVLICSGMFLRCGGGSGSASQGGGETAKLTHITIAPANPTIAKGTTLLLSATGSYDDGTERALAAFVTWQTSQSTIATINPQGEVTGVDNGVAQLSAAYQGVTGSTQVTVGPAVLLKITVGPNPSFLPVGESEQLTATGNYSDGTTQNLTQSATWSSSGLAIASVSPAGTAVANAVGATTVSATAGSVIGFAGLTVTPAVMVALNIIPATLSMVLGSSRQLQSIATFSDGTTQNVTGIVLWSSMQPAIASVSGNGLTIALQAGSTTILAQSGGLTGTANLTVVPLMAVNYFDRASAEKSGIDATFRFINPGLTPGNLCAMVYVFDRNQELNECCGCSISDSGLRSMSLILDLTANPLTGKKPTAGSIKVVPSNPGPNSQCDAGSIIPAGEILGWGTNVQDLSGGTFEVTETTFDMLPLSDGEATKLVNLCSFIEQSGGGRGVCSCGTGE
jgi:hypothetical protein